MNNYEQYCTKSSEYHGGASPTQGKASSPESKAAPGLLSGNPSTGEGVRLQPIEVRTSCVHSSGITLDGHLQEEHLAALLVDLKEVHYLWNRFGTHLGLDCGFINSCDVFASERPKSDDCLIQALQQRIAMCKSLSWGDVADAAENDDQLTEARKIRRNKDLNHILTANDVNDVYKVLKDISHNWTTLMLYMGLPHPDIKKLEKTPTTKQIMQRVLSHWISNGTGGKVEQYPLEHAKFRKVLVALCRLEYTRLAANLANKYKLEYKVSDK